MRRIFKIAALGSVFLLSICATVYAAEHIELPGNDRAFVDRLNSLGIHKEASSAEVRGLGVRKSYLHSFRGEALGLGADLSFHAFREKTDRAKVKHTRYRQMFKGIPIFAKELILHEDQHGKIQQMNGSIVNGVEQDLDPNVPLVPALSPAEALERAKNLLSEDSMGKRRRHSRAGAASAAETALPATGRFNYRNEESELNIYVDANNKPRLVYYVNFYAEPAERGEPTRPFLLIDAKTGQIVKRWEGLAHQAVGTGPGGNAKVGQYEYGSTYGYLDVLQNGTLCSMQNANVTTVNMTGMPTAYAAPFSYTCPRNTVKTVNGAYSPLNDAHYFGSVIVDMYTNWYGEPPIPLPLIMRPHYGTNYENAFWDGQYMTFGDGYTTFYPLVSLDVAAHEVSHGFTEFNSGLIYEKESGGLNESFSDMAGEAAEYFMRGSNDWRVGAEIVKGSEALRYLDNPAADGHSIDDYVNYSDSLDVHHSSGLFNKAFYLLATKPGWNTRKAFDVMVKANTDYWIAASTFRSAACGAITAATDLGYSATEVDSAFQGVNVYCGAPEIDTIVAPPAITMSGPYTFAAISAPFSQTFSATGGASPYTWSIVSGTLPTGLSLNVSTGEVSGTPTAVGAYQFRLQVMDSLGRRNFIAWSILVSEGLKAGWPRELQQRAGTGWLPESFSPVTADLDGDGRDEIIVSDVDTLYLFLADGTLRKAVLPGKVTTPVVADLDGDGHKEIIVSVREYFGSSNSIYAFRADLTPVAGFPAGAYSTYNGGPGFVSSPVVADFNNDGQLKIAVVASPNNTYDPNYEKNVVIMVDSQGRMVDGWPQVFGTFNSFDSPPAVGDIDRDGVKELVFATVDGNIRIFSPNGILLRQWQLGTAVVDSWTPVLADLDGDGYLDVVVKYTSSANGPGIAVFDRTGNLLPGWPRQLSASPPSGPIVADIDGDGHPEIIVVDGAYWNELHALRGDGTYLDGWPVTLPLAANDSAIYDCYPVVADINGDGRQEILVTTVDYWNNGKLYAYAADGIPLTGFPKYASPASEVRSTAAIGDLDGNGKLDLVVKSENGFLFAWEMPQDGGGFPRQWPMFRNDARHSGTWVPNRLNISPESHDFQGILTGSSSAPRSFAIANHRFENVVVSGITITGPDSSVFSLTPGTCGTLPVTLGPMQSCAVNASFAPAGAGLKEADLTVTASTPGMMPAQALLSGTGMLSSYRLTYTKAGGGNGTVTSSSGTNYPASGSEVVAFGTVVTLTANPQAGSVFTGWEGACTGTGDCTVTIDGDRQVTATFESTAAGVYQLDILRSGPGSSAVTYSPGGACPSLCSHLYGAGAVVTLKPALSADSRFSGWTGCDTVSGTICTVTMTGAKAVTASYRSILNVVAGGEHTVALKGDGTVWTWGDTSGLLGNSTIPAQVQGVSDAVVIASLGWHTAALKFDGTVWTWGSNIYGGLGDGTTTPRSRAGQVPGLANMVAVATGYFHTVALKEDGTVWAWGDNSSAQLGDGTETNRLSPVQVSGLSGVVAVAAGDNYTLALKGDGTVWAWGDNIGGQLGDGTYTRRPNPVQSAGLSGVVAISAGRNNALALKGDGTLWGWGYNYHGEVGDGTTTPRPLPLPVPGIAGAVSVGAGEYHSLVVGGDGTLKGWGSNEHGQLGDGTTNQQNSPVQVSGISNVVAADGGEYHSVALKGDGTIWTWGENANAQLGDGTKTDHLTPAQVPNINLLPAVTISGVPAGPTNSADATLTVGGSGIVAYKYRLDAGSYSAETAVATPITLTSLGEGTHAVSVLGKDSAGNWQTNPTTASWVVDLTPPTAAITGTPASPTNATSATLTVGGADVLSYKYRLDVGSYSAETAVVTPITLTSLGDGTHAVSVLGKDRAGNWQVTPTTVSWTVELPPVTTLTTNPAVANGTNGWFITTPTITLASNKPATTYYRWGGGTFTNYDHTPQAQAWVAGGTALGIRADDAGSWYPLPFAFSFYGTTYTSVYVSSNGLLRFDASDDGYSNGGTYLKTKAAIAPLWDDLMTSRRAGDDVFVFQPDPDSVGFRWQAVTQVGSYDTNLEAILYSDGRIRFNYGAQGGGLTPTVGISKGDGTTYHLAYDNNLTTANNIASIIYTPQLSWNTYTVALVPAAGDNIFNYYSVDTLGTAETARSQHIKVDTAAPVSAASPAGGAYVTAKSVTLSCGDGTGSGCAGTWYCLGAGCTPTTLYGGAVNIAASTDFRFYSKDTAGNNESAKTVTYVIDTTAPATTASPVGGTYNAAQSVTLSCTDNGGSGCAQTYYCLGAGCTPTTLYGSAVTIAASTDLRFYSRDVAGNSEAVRTATYTIVPMHVLSVAQTGTGSGTVSGGNIDCPTGGTTGCSSTLAAGTPVTLTATANPGSVFAGWGGPCSSVSGNQCSAVMDADKTITATFAVDCGAGACPDVIATGQLGEGVSINSLGEVVWVQYHQASGRNQLFSSLRGQLTFDLTDHRNPSLNNLGDLVWVESYWDAQLWQDIYVVKGTIGGQPVTVTSSQNWINKPDINDRGEVVWNQMDSSGISHIHSSLRGEMTSGNTFDDMPSINDQGEVIYTSFNFYAPPEPKQVYRLSPGNSVPVAVTSDLYDHGSPVINDNGELVWVRTGIGGTDPWIVSTLRGNLAPATNLILPVDLNNCGDVVYGVFTASGPVLFRLGNNAPCVSHPGTHDTQALAAQTALGDIFTGLVDGAAAPVNWYRFDAAAGDTIDVTVNYDNRAPNQLTIGLYDGQGNLLSGATTSSPLGIHVPATYSGTYYLKVTGEGGRFGYAVSLQRGAPPPAVKLVAAGQPDGFYATLTEAFSLAPAGASMRLFCRSGDFTEDLTVNRCGEEITISGGYDAGFSANAGRTAINGTVRVTCGKLVADGLVIR
jgi:vibriolysin